MHLSGEVSLRVPPERAFELLLDPRAVRAALGDDCEELVAETPERWQLAFKVGSGFFAARAKGEVEVLEAVWPTKLSAEASGKMTGGGVRVETSIELEAGGEAGGTRARWTAEVRLSGLAAAAPEGMLRQEAEARAARFFAALERQG